MKPLRKFPRRWLLQQAVFLATCVIAACGGNRAVTFQSFEPGSTISLVPLDNPNTGAVEKLANPVTLDGTKFLGKAVRISAMGKAPQFWFPPDDTGQQVSVRIKELGACEAPEGNKNRPVRMLLKAYQALSSRDFTVARELCSKVADLDPTIAAPHIIVGLTYFQEGNREQARVAFNKAGALDPEDQEIAQLLRMVQ